MRQELCKTVHLRSFLNICCLLRARMVSPLLQLCISGFAFAIFISRSEGADPFIGLISGTPCFSPRKITGCSGTLLDNFRPTVPYSDTNRPDTRMFLFTPKNPTFPEYLHDCGGRLPGNTNFNPSVRTEIFIHGWLDGSCRTAWMRECRDQLFIRGTYNVILIDWTWGNTFDYAGTAANDKVVGEQLAFLIQNIMDQTSAKPTSFHIIGHSIGAHIAGFAGKRIKNLGRITALDAALAPYKLAGPNDRLNKTDARLVDVIHSSDTECFPFNFGYPDPLGDADFYPNGGSIQLSCVPYILVSFLKADILYAFFTLFPNFCNHLQSTQYYKLSINSCYCEFVGVECPDYESFKAGRCRSCRQDGSRCAVMGMDFENYNYNKDGNYHKYYLDTTLSCPYCSNSDVNLQGFPVRNETTAYCSSTPNNNIGAPILGQTLGSLEPRVPF